MDSLLVDAIVIGCGATLVMDLVAVLLNRIFGLRSLDYGLVGRWGYSLLEGKFFHHPIFATPPVRHEMLIGWALHYLIGIAFAFLFLAAMGTGWRVSPSLFPALVFGAFTVAAPFFILQPAFGAGVAASQAPKPGLARAKSLLAHLSFGFGIWVSAALWSLHV